LRGGAQTATDAARYIRPVPVRAFLGALRLEQYVALFEANDIDAELLGGLTDADLATMGVASGVERRAARRVRAQ